MDTKPKAENKDYRRQVFHEDEISEFIHELHLAIALYFSDTGRRATHFVLGRREQAKFHAMIELRRLRGEPMASHTEPKETRYQGLLILNSSQKFCLLAVEQEGLL